YPDNQPAHLVENISNSGSVTVSASASARSFAAANVTAMANGIEIYAVSQIANSYSRVDLSSVASTVWHYASKGGTASGAVSNSGSVTVSASAPGGPATANGILVSADDSNVAVTNAKGGSI